MDPGQGTAPGIDSAGNHQNMTNKGHAPLRADKLHHMIKLARGQLSAEILAWLMITH